MKKNFTLQSIFAILMLFCVVTSYSQDRTCGMVEYMESINELYLDEAAAILNQEQFAAFQESLEQYATMQRAGLKMAEAMFGKKDEPSPEE